jgi:hypothetical protein
MDGRLVFAMNRKSLSSALTEDGRSRFTWGSPWRKTPAEPSSTAITP